jgi:hypothetical protein
MNWRWSWDEDGLRIVACMLKCMLAWFFKDGLRIGDGLRMGIGKMGEVKWGDLRMT